MVAVLSKPGKALSSWLSEAIWPWVALEKTSSTWSTSVRSSSLKVRKSKSTKLTSRYGSWLPCSCSRRSRTFLFPFWPWSGRHLCTFWIRQVALAFSRIFSQVQELKIKFLGLIGASNLQKFLFFPIFQAQKNQIKTFYQSQIWGQMQRFFEKRDNQPVSMIYDNPTNLDSFAKFRD